MKTSFSLLSLVLLFGSIISTNQLTHYLKTQNFTDSRNIKLEIFGPSSNSTSIGDDPLQKWRIYPLSEPQKQFYAYLYNCKSYNHNILNPDQNCIGMDWAGKYMDSICITQTIPSLPAGDYEFFYKTLALYSDLTSVYNVGLYQKSISATIKAQSDSSPLATATSKQGSCEHNRCGKSVRNVRICANKIFQCTHILSHPLNLPQKNQIIIFPCKLSKLQNQQNLYLFFYLLFQQIAPFLTRKTFQLLTPKTNVVVTLCGGPQNSNYAGAFLVTDVQLNSITVCTNVLVNGVTVCANSGFITNCVDYNSVNNGVLGTCKTCSADLKPSSDSSSCVPKVASDYIAHCSVLVTDSKTQCLTCESDFKTSSDSSSCVRKVASDYILHCTELVSGFTTQCSQCSLGWAPSSTKEVCQQVNIPHCTSYNIIDHSKCDQCENGWIANSLKTLCFYDISSNCALTSNPSATTQPVCLLCKIGFTLSMISVTATESFNLCISTSVSIPHCASLSLISGSSLFSCSQCKSGYSKIDFTVDGKTVTKCVSSVNFVDNCAQYSEAPLSCTYKCTECKAGFGLASVYTSSTGRIKQQCLQKDTEFLPHCNLFVEFGGSYFCKNNHCSDSAVPMKIGADAKQIACTTFTLFPESRECSIYERPLEEDTGLRCSVCKDVSAQGASCSTVE